MNATHDIFISYSRQDAEIVKKLCKELVSAGFSLWIDENGIESGDAFKSIIVKAIEDCNTLLFFSSQSSNKSYWTTKEISIAIYEGKTIIPIKLDDSKYNSEIKFDLINLDYIDLTNQSFVEDEIHRLIRSLRNRLLPDINISTESNEIPEKTNRKRMANLKFIFQYKGCIVSLTLCIVGIIVVPFLFMNNKTMKSTYMPNSTFEEIIAYSGENNRTEDFEMENRNSLIYPSVLSVEGFIINVDYYADYTPVVHDTILADSVDVHPDYIEIVEPEYIKYMEAGIEYVQNRSFEDAYNQFLKAANLGCSDAMYNVSISHLTGIGADVDTLKAIKWLQKASELNNQCSINKLKALNN